MKMVLIALSLYTLYLARWKYPSSSVRPCHLGIGFLQTSFYLRGCCGIGPPQFSLLCVLASLVVLLRVQPVAGGLGAPASDLASFCLEGSGQCDAQVRSCSWELLSGVPVNVELEDVLQGVGE